MTAVVERLHGPIPRQGAGPVELAVADLSAGRTVVLFDDTAHEGMLLMAGAAATKQAIAFMVQHTSGFLRAPMPAETLDRLNIPPMRPRHEDQHSSSFAVAVDASTGVTTGISAGDRACTFRTLADPESVPSDLVRPGHVIPQRAAPGGVIERPCYPEAAVELVTMTGQAPVAVIGELVDDAGKLMPRAESHAFARKYEMNIVSIANLVHYVRQ